MQTIVRTSPLGRIAAQAVATVALPRAHYVLNVALVYQDSVTQRRAQQVRELLAQTVDEDALSCTEWRIDRLKEPKTYTAGAVALAQADVMVFAVDEDKPFPPEFYLWVNLWLEMRSVSSGALVALLGTSGQWSRTHNEVKSYLYAVASQARLSLFFKEGDADAEVTNSLGAEFIQWANAV